MDPRVSLPTPEPSIPNQVSSLLVVHDPRFRAHDPGHDCPERPERFHACQRALARLSCPFRLEKDVPEATRSELGLVHDKVYVNRILALRGRSLSLDHETHLSAGSVPAALRAAGAALFLTREILGGCARRGFALVRPPGHHAGRAQAQGYCVFNNLALAALKARRQGAERVLVVDFDVHHGNGSEEILAQEPGVLFVSIHQAGLFPADSGAVAVPSSWAGGTLNVPVPPLATDADYAHIAQDILGPVAARFCPDFVLVSCGFDAHWRDEQGGMRLSSEGLVAIAASLCTLADAHAGGRIGFVLEGGYDLEALEECVAGTLDMLAGKYLRPALLEEPRPEVCALVLLLRARMGLA